MNWWTKETWKSLDRVSGSVRDQIGNCFLRKESLKPRSRTLWSVLSDRPWFTFVVLHTEKAIYFTYILSYFSALLLNQQSKSIYITFFSRISDWISIPSIPLIFENQEHQKSKSKFWGLKIGTLGVVTLWTTRTCGTTRVENKHESKWPKFLRQATHLFLHLLLQVLQQEQVR